MSECIHGLEVGCTFCSGKETTRQKPPRPIKYDLGGPQPHRDRDAVLAERIVLGEICSICLMEHAPLGCACRRREFYDDRLAEAKAWVEANGDELVIAGIREPSGLAFSAQRRGGNRAGLSADEHQADRLDIIEQFDVEPKWRQYRRQEADFMPV